MFKKIRHIHFIGIGGIGMSGLAEVLFNMGYVVSGSDINKSDTVERLRSLGVKISIGHKSFNINGADVVVYSQAISNTNVELVHARKEKIPIIKRAEMLAELMRLKCSIAVAGTHGKTTTTSMASLILTYAGLDPTIVIGGKLKTLGINAKFGKGELLIAEADESDASFLSLFTTIVIVTNIDNDHLDHYNNMDNLKNAFIKFINNVPFYGCAILCADDVNVRSILPSINRRVITYAIDNKADIKAEKITLTKNNSIFRIKAFGKEFGEIKLSVIGKHNILNALAAVAMGMELDINFGKIKTALGNFTGVTRRCEKIGETNDVLVIDDYAHHPTEIKSIIKAVKLLKRRRIIVVFQPHRYSRTKLLYKDFPNAFKGIDKLYLTNIYSAGEKHIKGITSKLIFNELIKKRHKNVVHIENIGSLPSLISKEAKKGDLILVLGAGDILNTGKEILKNLSRYNG